MSPSPYAVTPWVVVLTGGASRRMGSHKPLLDVGGQPLVERVLAAASPWPAVVVGPGDGVPDGARVVTEPEPGGGPVAGLAVGVEAVGTAAVDAGRATPDVVVVLAADLPFVDHAHLGRLVAALDPDATAHGADLAVTVDPAGRRNWLCAAWRTAVLRDRLATVGDPHGRSMREVADGIRTALVDDLAEVALDVDTPADLERARRRAGDA